jgi:hypothetical protein
MYLLYGITYFDWKYFPVFFNYYMKYYLKPQRSIHFKNKLIEIYKVVRTFLILLQFWKYRKLTTFFQK